MPAGWRPRSRPQSPARCSTRRPDCSRSSRQASAGRSTSAVSPRRCTAYRASCRCARPGRARASSPRTTATSPGAARTSTSAPASRSTDRCTAMPADDRFDVYYAEKLWELIPPYYRDLDGEQQPPGVLRALIEVFAEQAATLRRSQDRVWEDQFIERCDAWAVPYIGDLLATRPVSALLPREQRIDVAKTIYYRR